MKRAIPLVVIVAAVFFGYRYYRHSYTPVATYKQFADAVLHRNYDAAAALTHGLSPKDLEQSGSQEKIGAGPAMFQTLFPSRYEIQSMESGPDGTLTLHVVQTVLFNPPGVESGRPAMYAKMNQTVTMRDVSGWKVTHFENKFDSMDTLRSQ